MKPVTAVATDMTPAEAYLHSVAEDLASLHRDLLQLMSTVALVEEPLHGTAETGIALRPTPRQHQESATLVGRYRRWSERVRPFLDRTAWAPVDSFDEAFALLSSYFALRRIGTGLTHQLWRELFELESTRIVAALLELLDEHKECFALLNPRPAPRMEELDIRFVPLGGGRHLVLAESRRGQASAEMTIPFDPRDVENFILRHCDPHRGAVRGWAPPSVQPFADFGAGLFDALFTGPVRDLYLQHAAAVASDDVGLGIRLRVTSVPELAGLPWEYLYDGTAFLALTGAVTITRHLDASRPARAFPLQGPLGIAVTVSAPTDRAPIDADRELEGLKTALAPLVSAGLVRIDVAPDGTIATLATMLRDAEVAGRPFHVWHFIGHGRFMERQGATYLAFEDANGTPQMQSGFELGTLLSAHPHLRLAVLNACEGARAAPEDSLTSVGGALVARGLPAAVAMQFSISDVAAIRFADIFYRSLADGGSIDAAVMDARRSIFFMPNASEWATPTVTARTVDETLFTRRL